MIDQLENLQAEFNSLELSLGDPELFQNQPLYLKTMKRYSDLKGIVGTFRSYQKVMDNDAKAREALTDPELIEMAREELAQLETEKLLLERKLQRLLLPKDPFDFKNVIIEIRAAAGGDEAQL